MPEPGCCQPLPTQHKRQPSFMGFAHANGWQNGVPTTLGRCLQSPPTVVDCFVLQQQGEASPCALSEAVLSPQNLGWGGVVVLIRGNLRGKKGSFL